MNSKTHSTLTAGRHLVSVKHYEVANVCQELSLIQDETLLVFQLGRPCLVDGCYKDLWYQGSINVGSVYL